MDERGAVEIRKPPPPNPGITSCCGHHMVDGPHPRMCEPQKRAAIFLSAYVVFMFGLFITGVVLTFT